VIAILENATGSYPASFSFRNPGAAFRIYMQMLIPFDEGFLIPGRQADSEALESEEQRLS